MTKVYGTTITAAHARMQVEFLRFLDAAVELEQLAASADIDDKLVSKLVDSLGYHVPAPQGTSDRLVRDAVRGIVAELEADGRA
jgi:hypothetical protein